MGVTEFAKGRFNTPKAILLRNLLLAFLPAAAIGFCFDDLIERYLFSPLPVVLALLVGALIMIGCELRKKPAQPKTLEELSPFGALKIGFWQLLALWPGMSRSMTTIVGGLQGGLSRAAAAEFSFLLGAAVLGAAGVYKIICNYEALFTLGLSQILIGTVAAFISAFFVVKFFVGTLNHYGLLPWAIYRLVLVTILVIL